MATSNFIFFRKKESESGTHLMLKKKGLIILHLAVLKWRPAHFIYLISGIKEKNIQDRLQTVESFVDLPYSRLLKINDETI